MHNSVISLHSPVNKTQAMEPRECGHPQCLKRSRASINVARPAFRMHRCVQISIIVSNS